MLPPVGSNSLNQVVYAPVQCVGSFKAKMPHQTGAAYERSRLAPLCARLYGWRVAGRAGEGDGAPMASEAADFLDEVARERLRAALRTHPRALLSDVDGTLSAIAPTPEAATLLPGVADLLRQATDIFDVVAAVSGRAATDARRLVGLPGLLYIGNHGFERIEPTPDASADDALPAAILGPGLERYAGAIAEVLGTLETALAGRWPGLRLESKGVTATIHVRATADPTAAEAEVFALAEGLAQQRGLRVTRGRMVVELRPPGTTNKGTAVAALIHERGLRGALYLGDDRTDIDAFRALRQLTAEGVCLGAAVAVLSPEAPVSLTAEADVTLDSIERVPTLLRWLLAEAQAS